MPFVFEQAKFLGNERGTRDHAKSGDLTYTLNAVTSNKANQDQEFMTQLGFLPKVLPAVVSSTR